VFIAILIMAVIFDFLNGFHDSSNIVATVIFSRALHPRVALIIAAIAEFLGPFLFGVAVARTIGNDLLTDKALSEQVVMAALMAAVLWNLLTWYLGMPSSSSHALLGGLLGAALLYTQTLSVIRIDGLTKIVLALLLSPVAGLIMGFIVMRITLWLVRNATPRVSTVFRRLQIVTLIGLALSHGTNDAQKTMGVLTLTLFLTGRIASFYVPVWVIALSASAIALGTAFGGWRLIRTLGGRIYRIRPIHGFTSQIAGAAVILTSALFGGPVSTTQVLSSSIVGAGAAERFNKVRWTILRDMALAWVLTIPATALASILIFSLLQKIL
jgi:PiT family inorganic phosphate transporter